MAKCMTRGAVSLSCLDPSQLLAEVPATLRRLFELLGATYIKLGQFVASSPTLFPAEYVTEFQKCLDNTEVRSLATY